MVTRSFTLNRYSLFHTTSDNNEGKTEIAVVLPAYNEAVAIDKVLDNIQTALQGRNFVTVVVDGNSTDGTTQIAKNREAQVLRQGRHGYGDAVSLGFEYAVTRFDPSVVVLMDADGTYDPDDIPKLASPILTGDFDMVLGNRFGRMEKGAMTSTNRLGNRLISWLCRSLLGIGVFDTQTGMRALNPGLISVFGKSGGMTFATAMLAEAYNAGARILEVPIAYYQRLGETKLNPIKDGIRIVGIILRLVRDYKPLLFFGGLGAASFVVGLLLGLGTIVEWTLTGTVSRLPTAILAVLLISIGTQFFSLGLVADMIKSLHERRLR